MSLLIRLVTHLFLNVMARRSMKSSVGRWILGVVFTLLGAACVTLAVVTPDSTQQIGFAIGAGFFLLLAGIVWVSMVMIRRRLHSIADESAAYTKQLIAEGKLLPVPAAPANLPQGVTPEDVANVEGYVKRMRAIPWGQNPSVNEYDAPIVFQQALEETLTNSGRWDLLLSGPVMVFAGLPRPWCHIGAAEVMYRLSFLRGAAFAPAGLRQGLFFAVHAQVRQPRQPDALIAQLELLSALRAPTWQERATKTRDMLHRNAPHHPHLAQVEMTYHRRRGEDEQALECADLALNHPVSPAIAANILDGKAGILMALNRYDEAVGAFQAALSRKPNDPWIWHNLSRTHTELGRYQTGPLPGSAGRQRARALPHGFWHGPQAARDHPEEDRLARQAVVP